MRLRATLLSLALVSTACCRAARPDPLASTTPPALACAGLTAPPEERPVVLAKPGEQGCPLTFARCIDAPNAAALADNVERLRAYAREAWTRCGPQPRPQHARRNLIANAPDEPPLN